MLLSDYTIKRYIIDWKIRLTLPKWDDINNIIKNVEWASFDLRLWNKFKKFPRSCEHVLSPFDKTPKVCMEEVILKDNEDIILQPWDFMLWATKERIWLPDDLIARVEGRSSIARIWVMVHITWWYVNPWFGWEDQSSITLEIKNVNNVPVALRADMKICQIIFERLDSSSETPYYKKKTAKYNGQVDPTNTRLYMNS